MQNILIALIIGVIAGLIDVIPMIVRKLNKTSCISAFIHYLALGLIIPFINWELEPWIKGMIISLILSLPVMVIVFSREKRAIIPMTIFALILGAGIGIAGAKFIG